MPIMVRFCLCLGLVIVCAVIASYINKITQWYAYSLSKLLLCLILCHAYSMP